MPDNRDVDQPYDLEENESNRGRIGPVPVVDPELTRALATTKSETVNHPQHYGGDTVYEVIKVLRAWNLNFALGNAVKYIARAGKKNLGNSIIAATIEDLRKSLWYIQNEIEILEKELSTNKK